jgi:hypothetical protein
MTEAGWLASKSLFDMRRGYPTAWDVRKARLFWCACIRRAWDVVADEDVRGLVLEMEDHPEAGKDWSVGEFAHLFERHHAQESGRNAWALNGLFDAPPDSWDTTGWVARRTAQKAVSDTYDVRSDRWKKQVDDLESGERVSQCNLLRDIFGNPFRPVTFSPSWRTDTTFSLARQMYDARDFSAMPILADALQDAGCDSEDILNHCRGDGPHVRGCWVCDLVLGKS